LLQAEDIAGLRAFGDYRRAAFSRDLAAKAKVTASNVRGNAPAYAAANLVDGRADSFWATDDALLNAQAVVDFGRPATFSVIRLREEIRLGQRIDSVAVDQWNAGTWEPLATATSIGPRRLIRLEKAAETNRLRLRVTQASASPALTEFAVFAEPVDALR
jgi:alpha-L-fucosidase